MNNLRKKIFRVSSFNALKKEYDAEACEKNAKVGVFFFFFSNQIVSVARFELTPVQ